MRERAELQSTVGMEMGLPVLFGPAISTAPRRAKRATAREACAWGAPPASDATGWNAGKEGPPASNHQPHALISGVGPAGVRHPPQLDVLTCTEVKKVEVRNVAGACGLHSRSCGMELRRGAQMLLLDLGSINRRRV